MNNDRITALEQQLAAIQTEIEQLKAEEQSKEVKPWRAKIAQDYFSLSSVYCVLPSTEAGNGVNNTCYKIGNYYRTRELAEQDARELALRGRVRQLRDALCEGYKFVSGKNNFYLFMNEIQGRYSVSDITRCPSIGEIYFDTREHAQTACDILNAERGKESGGNG